MKQPMLGGIVAGALAGAVTGFAAAALFAPVADDAPIPAVISPKAGDTDDLRAELAALRSKNVELSQRLAELEDLRRELVQARVPARDSSEVTADVETIDQLRQLTAALEDPGTPLPESLIAGVGTALQRIREDEERARDEARRAYQSERLDERITELTDRLGLTLVQAGQMRTHLESMADRRNEMMRTARDSGDFGSIREQMRGLRDEAEAALGQILTPQQLDDYHAIEREEGYPFFGRGGPRRGDDGGNRDDSRQ